MAKELKDKVFYKVWEIQKHWYITGSRDKSTWATLNGAEAKIRDMCQSDHRYYSNHLINKPEDFEIQLFHMVKFDTIDGRTAYESKEKKAQAEKLRLQKISALQIEIKAIVHGIDFYTIREMLKHDIFSNKITDALLLKFSAITLLERNK